MRRRPDRGPRRAQAGFTLLEVLAAFVVFALVFATTLQVLSGALRNTQRSADYTEAALWAQQVMESVGIDPLLEEGSYSGKFDDDYSWEMDIMFVELEELVLEETLEAVLEDEPEEVPAAGGAQLESVNDAFEIPIDLYRVELRVYWGEAGSERMARFRTLRSITPGAR